MLFVFLLLPFRKGRSFTINLHRIVVPGRGAYLGMVDCLVYLVALLGHLGAESVHELNMTLWPLTLVSLVRSGRWMETGMRR